MFICLHERTKEVWKPTKYQDYIVSNRGRIKSLKYHSMDGKSSRILSQNADRDGYMTCTLYPKKKYVKAKIHRLVAESFCKGQTDQKALALHIDGNKLNNMAFNLYWGDAKDNKADSVKHGTNTNDWTWKTAPSRKLQPRNVKRIRKLLLTTSVTKIAEMYDLAYKTIYDIKVGKTWRHLLPYS
jgi:hypothetical protein